MRQALIVGVGAAVALMYSSTVHAAFVNGGGELYPGYTAIPHMGPIPPADGTGWNAGSNTQGGSHGVEGLTTGAPLSGSIRLAFGSTNANIPSEDAVLFQDTGIIANTGDKYALNFFGRGYFNYEQGVDFQTSFFGYHDGTDLIQVETLQHPQILDDSQGGWTAAEHIFEVPASMDGQSLVVGFFTATGGAAGGGFTAVDDVTLTLVPEPTSLVLCLVASGMGLVVRRGRG